MNDFVGPWVRRFLVEYVIGECNYSSNTQHSYRDTFRLLLPWAAKQCRCTVEHLPLERSKPKLLREFTLHLEQVRHCGPATINQRLAALRAWAHFVATQSPEHLEWSTQIQTIQLKKCTSTPANYLEKSGNAGAAEPTGPANPAGSSRLRFAPVFVQPRRAPVKSHG
jgi:site-specific recombinase XerD